MKRLLTMLLMVIIFISISQTLEARANTISLENLSKHWNVPIIDLNDLSGKTTTEVILIGNEGGGWQIFSISQPSGEYGLGLYLAYAYVSEKKTLIFDVATQWELIPYEAIKRNGWIAVVAVNLHETSLARGRLKAIETTARIFCEPRYRRLNFPSSYK